MLASALTTFHSNSGACGLSGKRAIASLASLSDWGGSDAASSCSVAISDASSRGSGAGGSASVRGGLGAAVSAGTGTGTAGSGSPRASVNTDGVGSALDACVSDGSGTVRGPDLSSRANTPKTTARTTAAAPRTTRMEDLDTTCRRRTRLRSSNPPDSGCHWAGRPDRSLPSRVFYLRLGTRSRVMVWVSVMPAFTVAVAFVS
jgi:hypothetical protein